jgi:hypothetical protein
MRRRRLRGWFRRMVSGAGHPRPKGLAFPPMALEESLPASGSLGVLSVMLWFQQLREEALEAPCHFEYNKWRCR